HHPPPPPPARSRRLARPRAAAAAVERQGRCARSAQSHDRAQPPAHRGPEGRPTAHATAAETGRSSHSPRPPATPAAPAAAAPARAARPVRLSSTTCSHLSRVNRRRHAGFSFRSTPCTWNTFFAKSTPTRISFMVTPPLLRLVDDTSSLAHRCRLGEAVCAFQPYCLPLTDSGCLNWSRIEFLQTNQKQERYVWPRLAQALPT